MSWAPTELDPRSDQIREVFAHYGSAMYHAQVLEHGLANFVVASQIGSRLKTTEAIEALWEEMLGQTMGRQLEGALKAAEFEDAEIEQLRRALRTRNFLAHDYFKERAEHLLSFAGRSEMIGELERMRRELEAADEVLEPRTRTMLERWGVTHEVIAAELTRVRKEHDDTFRG